MSAEQSISTETFRGLCFTAVKVRYLGPTNYRDARWGASLYRGQDDVTRVTESYDYGRPMGAQNALPVAQACFAKAREAIDVPTDPAEWVAIPAELSADSYIFTFVPAYLFGGQS